MELLGLELNEIIDLENRLVKSIKHNCLLCHARRTFDRPTNPEKELVVASLDALATAFENKYNLLRKGNYSTEKIRKALDNKHLCMDTKDTCKNCDREVDRANRHMADLKYWTRKQEANI